MKVFMEVTRDIQNPLRRLNWLQCGYEFVEGEGRVFAVRREVNDNNVERGGVKWTVS